MFLRKEAMSQHKLSHINLMQNDMSRIFNRIINLETVRTQPEKNSPLFHASLGLSDDS